MSTETSTFGRVSEADYQAYRALSAAAVTSTIFGVASILVFLSLFMALIPLIGIVIGLFALRSIRAREEELTGRLFAFLGIGLSASFLVSGMATASIIYATEVPDGYTRISYTFLQPEEGTNQLVPPAAEDLDGQRVFIKGYVYPGAKKRGITEFLLVRDKGDCCFGGAPLITDRVQIRLQDDLKLNFSGKIHKVAGTFRVDAERSDRAIDAGGGVYYYLDADFLETGNLW